MLPPNVEQLLVNREPLGDEKLYSLRSPNGSWTCSVHQEEPLTIRTTWRVRFITDSGVVAAAMALNSFDFEFFNATGEPRGQGREASLSVAGKSIITDQNDQVLGIIAPRLKATDFLSADGKLVGSATRSMPKGLPIFLRPSKSHLVDQFVWNRVSPQPIDERLILGYVCILVATEFNRG